VPAIRNSYRAARCHADCRARAVRVEAIEDGRTSTDRDYNIAELNTSGNMATHRAMQSAGMTVTAAAPLSGPYALSAFADAIFGGRVDMDAPTNFTLLSAKSFFDSF
jgi:hypothetical protein